MASTRNSVVLVDKIRHTSPSTEMATVPSVQEPDKVNDPFLVTFSSPRDSLNPKDWSTSRKWTVTDVLSASGFNRIMVSTIMAPALATIAHELDMNPTEVAMSLSIYILASAFGPMIIGPLSEVYGRETMLHTTSVWFLVWNAVCGFAHSKEVLIASRFMAGFGASSIYALAGVVLGDIWRPEQRGTSLGLYLLIPILGAAVGPIIGGLMAARTTWRWMYWSTSIFQAVMILVSLTAFRETYAPVILRRRAAKLRRTTGDDRYYTVQERLEEKKSLLSVLTRAVSRPMRLLAFHPLIQTTSIISAFYYGILYILLSSFSELWTERYKMSVEISGLHYIVLTINLNPSDASHSPFPGPFFHPFSSSSTAGLPSTISTGLSWTSQSSLSLLQCRW
ncbi:MFS general substrate transporter [Massarina eburnea CBS 473.64]|uniref:MFS general substrate transporter n=1 Tax=Massarina eburnea CBS 473.64 TaxID=1395130 RepID=A0A6A6S331_9PLEO|nr:MFS general substrate transporter [Massarina eburnea CBS 473.64]